MDRLLEERRDLERQLEKLRGEMRGAASSDLTAAAREIAGVRVLMNRVAGADGKQLRPLVDELRDKLGSGIVLLAAEKDDGVSLALGRHGRISLGASRPETWFAKWRLSWAGRGAAGPILPRRGGATRRSSTKRSRGSKHWSRRTANERRNGLRMSSRWVESPYTPRRRGTFEVRVGDVGVGGRTPSASNP